MNAKSERGTYVTVYLPTKQREYLRQVGERSGIGTNAIISQSMSIVVRFMQERCPGLEKRAGAGNDELQARMLISDLLLEVGKRLS